MYSIAVMVKCVQINKFHVGSGDGHRVMAEFLATLQVCACSPHLFLTASLRSLICIPVADFTLSSQLDVGLPLPRVPLTVPVISDFLKVVLGHHNVNKVDQLLVEDDGFKRNWMVEGLEDGIL